MNDFEKRLGIIQGRLLRPVDNQIQEFPTKNWEKEFELIDELDINFIEWIVTKKSFDNLFNLNLKKYSHKISSICCDHIIDSRILDKYFINKYLVPICDFCLINDVKNITIPLLEESSLNESNFEKLKNNFTEIANDFNNLNFFFEIDANYELIKKFINLSNNFFFTYDTGNLTNDKYDHNEFIKNTFIHIRNVHLKDKTINPSRTVKPLTGETDFKKIFKTLKDLNYMGIFTIQTARGLEGNEYNTIKQHKKIFENLFYE